MNASAFLAHLESEGVRLTLNAGQLAVKTRRGASADPYIDLIRLNRAGLLAILTGERADIPWITADDLHRVPVFRGEVVETVPPADWNGMLPASCAWSTLCTVLGPCPHVTQGRCHSQHQPSVAPGRAVA
jgi:hypothetical protein